MTWTRTLPARLAHLALALLVSASRPALADGGDQQALAALASARQLVLVTAAGWSSQDGILRRYARDADAAPWSAVGTPLTVSLGRGGLGWGRGLHRVDADEAAQKREGDGRSPAGIFRLTAAFGYAARDSALARRVRLPYWPATADLQCVDDPASRHYNRIVERSRVADVDWNSHEEMRRRDAQYAFGVFVAHNSEPPLPGAGSCIFLHVWRGPGQPTAGCTATAAADVEALLLWLDADRQPLLVQLPDDEYARRREAWRLP